jgi:hypothetical protein
VEIKEFKKINKPNSPMKASFLVHIPDWDFNLSMLYFQKEDGKNWFGYPQQEYTNQQGEKKYKWLAFFGENGKARFEKVLREKLHEKIENEEPLPF